MLNNKAPCGWRWPNRPISFFLLLGLISQRTVWYLLNYIFPNLNWRLIEYVNTWASCASFFAYFSAHAFSSFACYFLMASNWIARHASNLDFWGCQRDHPNTPSTWLLWPLWHESIVAGGIVSETLGGGTVSGPGLMILLSTSTKVEPIDWWAVALGCKTWAFGFLGLGLGWGPLRTGGWFLEVGTTANILAGFFGAFALDLAFAFSALGCWAGGGGLTKSGPGKASCSCAGSVDIFVSGSGLNPE